MLSFEWDPRKSAPNKRKHGIDFAFAARVFAGPLRNAMQKATRMEKSGGGRSARSTDESFASPTRSAKKVGTKSTGSSLGEKPRLVRMKFAGKFPELTKDQERQLAYIDRLPDDRIDTSDIPDLPADFKGPVYVGLVPGSLTKKSITIRLDSDVVKRFKSRGKGWQTRMNWVLRLYYASHRKTGVKVGRP